MVYWNLYLLNEKLWYVQWFLGTVCCFSHAWMIDCTRNAMWKWRWYPYLRRRFLFELNHWWYELGMSVRMLYLQRVFWVWVWRNHHQHAGFLPTPLITGSGKRSSPRVFIATVAGTRRTSHGRRNASDTCAKCGCGRWTFRRSVNMQYVGTMLAIRLEALITGSYCWFPTWTPAGMTTLSIYSAVFWSFISVLRCERRKNVEPKNWLPTVLLGKQRRKQPFAAIGNQSNI